VKWISPDVDAEPFVSIIIPAYNAADTIARAVQSALMQRGAAIEVIVVDDGSSDSTLEVVMGLARGESRLEVLSQPNTGTAGALNRGLLRARGKLVASLGADDELSPEYLETMSAFAMEHPGYGIYSHDCWVIAPDGTRHLFFGWNSVRSVTLDDLLRECAILGGGTLVDRRLLADLGGYRQEAYTEDYDLWLRALAHGARHLYCPRSLYNYYLSPQSQKTGQRRLMYLSTIDMFQDFIDRYTLTLEQLELAEGTISKFRRYAEELDVFGYSDLQQTQEWAQKSRARLTRILSKVLPSTVVEQLILTMSSSPFLRAARRLWWDTRWWCAKKSMRKAGSRERH